MIYPEIYDPKVLTSRQKELNVNGLEYTKVMVSF